MIENKYEFSRQPRFLPEMPMGEIEIPNPPSQYEKPEISWFMLLLPPLVMIAITCFIALNYQSMFMMISIVTTVITLIGSLYGATGQIKKYKKNKTMREKKYLQLIADIKAELEVGKEKQIQAMNESNPESAVCLQRIINTDSKLWERTPAFNDFLSLRIGIGSAPLSVKVKYSKPQMTIESDPLADEPEKLAIAYERVDNVPVFINLFTSEICGIAGDDHKVSELLRLMMLQIITHHGYDDVKVVLLLKNDSLEKWNWARHLQHVWDDDYKNRYIVCGQAIARQTLSELYDMLKKRELKANSSGQYGNNLPHYVFIIEDMTLLENEPINQYLYSGHSKIGVSSVFVAKNRAYLPTNCKVVVNVQSKNGEYANRDTGEKTFFSLDKLDDGAFNKAVRYITPLRIKGSASNFTLPNSIELMEMLGAEGVEEVDIMERWSKNKTFKGMGVPIGAIPGNELFYLDIHETGHGPHGLVAGTTGSGKSELLQSIIISLAINYHPHDVVFVLIDYKGGGMADVFQGMPHLVGTITNLGGNQTTRALVSIKSELQRRQRIFSEFGVNNIDKYQKLYHNRKNQEAIPPIPHLIMIADEFAELKQEQPEFIKELVSTARVGRSLGVHLILATQKPAGVVDEQIWSNSKFKICLKVQDEADSKDVIKRPDAAMIKEPGRAYIQVGNDEMFEIFQSTWSGADYDPKSLLKQDKNMKKRIYKISLNGKETQIYPKEEEKIAAVELDSQLKAMVAHISDQAQKHSIEPLKGPWLPPLQERIYLDDLYAKASYGFQYDKGEWLGNPPLLSPGIGIIDNPREQLQESFSLDFMSGGHLFVYGSPGTGKTCLLQALCMSLAHLYSPKDVNIYVMDFGGTAFKQFEALPHCGGVMFLEQEKKINQFMLFIFRIIEERKKIFEEKRVGNFQEYKAKYGDELPGIFLFIDNYFALVETYEEIDDKMLVLAREGAKYGIYLIVTATNATLVRYKFAVNFKMTIALQLTDKSEYNDIVGRTEGLEPAPVLGRGLVKSSSPLEIQVSLPEFKDKDLDTLLSTFEALVQKGCIPKAKLIPEMPSVVDISTINKTNRRLHKGMVAIGLNDNDLRPIMIDLKTMPFVMIAGDIQTGKSSLLMSWLKTLSDGAGEENLKIFALDSSAMDIYTIFKWNNVMDLSEIEDMYSFVEEIKEEIESRRIQLNDCKRNNGNIQELYDDWQQMIFAFDNFNEFTESDNYALKELLERIIKKERELKISIIAVGDTNGFAANWDSLGKTMRETQTGILLGGLKEQNLFNVRVPYGTYEKELELGDGYFITKGKYVGLRAAYMNHLFQSYDQSAYGEEIDMTDLLQTG